MIAALSLLIDLGIRLLLLGSFLLALWVAAAAFRDCVQRGKAPVHRGRSWADRGCRCDIPCGGTR